MCLEDQVVIDIIFSSFYHFQSIVVVDNFFFGISHLVGFLFEYPSNVGKG